MPPALVEAAGHGIAGDLADVAGAEDQRPITDIHALQPTGGVARVGYSASTKLARELFGRYLNDGGSAVGTRARVLGLLQILDELLHLFS
jgi:hypothetical protein